MNIFELYGKWASGQKNDSLSRQVVIYRIAIVLIIVFPLVLRTAFLKANPDTFAPMPVQMLLNGCLLVVLGLTFINSFKRSVFYVLQSLVYLYSAYHIFLLVRNDFLVNFILEFILFLLIAACIFTKRRNLYAFLFSSYVVFSVALFTMGHNRQDVFIDLVLSGLFVVSASIFFETKFRIDHRIGVKSSLLKAIFNESTDGIIIVDDDTKMIVDCNDSARDFFRIQSQETLCKNTIDSLFGQSVIDFINKESSFMEAGKFYLPEYKILLSDGEEFWSSIAVSKFNVLANTYLMIRVIDITQRINDRKKVEESQRKLSQQGEILNEIINLLPHEIYLKDHESRFILVNQACANLHNLSVEEMIGKNDFYFFEPDTAQVFLNLEKEIIDKQETRKFDAEVSLDNSGKMRIKSVLKMPFYLSDVNATGILGLNIDVTELKLNEKAIRESESKYKTLMEQASDGIYLADEQGNVLEVNQKACEILGYDHEELLGLNINQLIASDQITDLSHLIPQSKDLQFVIIESSFVRKDGTHITMELSAKIFEDGKHQAIIRDVTERKRVENILIENERKFRSLIENSSDVIVILNEDYTIKFISQSVERILGYNTDEVIGKFAGDYIQHTQRDAVIRFFEDVMKNPASNMLMDELALRSKEGRFLQFETVAANLLTDPNIQGIVLNCHDITKRKQTEIELLNTNFELDSFVYKASHDLKAPLRSVMGLIKLAKLESKDDNIDVYFDMMSKSVTSLDTFIKDLTQFSRNSRMQVEPVKINFDEIVSEALANLKFVDYADKIKLDVKIDVADFYSDQNRIGTIVNNLLSNAFKYHRFEDNNPYINISISSDQEFVRIVVEDNGIGIDASHIDKIFDMFYRASETSYGSGLGLYILKSAITKLNGEVLVTSKLGEGTKFDIRIPNCIYK